MEWTLFVFAIGVAALVIGGASLARWGERRGRRGPGWSALKVFVVLELLLDALPSDRDRIELPGASDVARTSTPRRAKGAGNARKRRPSRKS
ncbi:hypothetical protein [Deinococcus yavapaiensis]|uniref:Uncharacterized protein n=1 Tax=Deinococcus yavapaiensis KR-236 TaxID=694435 RepID=A0A318SE72_9DEIO|nr:hypothetical protein [Deinococcus yavapaiensis]PYE55381.1 hypothetical protein DES52_103214 [Deinococcus yavapaiensis KR-236]